MKKWLPIIIVIISAVSGILEPALVHAAAAWAASDPKSAAAVAGILAAVLHGLESPPAVTTAVKSPAKLLSKKAESK